MKIPKIIHQIWSGIDEALPKHFKELGETWKRDYPEWQYYLWNNQSMNDFIKKYYPQYWDIYNKFPYNIQRWDAVRYLILDKIGGMYVDFDYESIEPMNNLLKDKTCYFAQEPMSHSMAVNWKYDKIFNNALMGSVPKHPFIRRIINYVFSPETLENKKVKDLCVLETTGPHMLLNLYSQINEDEKTEIHLIPAMYVTPFDVMQANRFKCGETSLELESCLDKAYAVHYFFSTWRRDLK